MKLQTPKVLIPRMQMFSLLKLSVGSVGVSGSEDIDVVGDVVFERAVEEFTTEAEVVNVNPNGDV
jgi:hypothetical protein